MSTKYRIRESGIAHRVERFLVAGGDQHPLLPDKFEKILLSKYVQIHLFHCCFVLYRGHIFDPVTVNSANLHKKLIFSSVCADEHNVSGYLDDKAYVPD